MNFYEALKLAMEDGAKIRRASWWERRAFCTVDDGGISRMEGGYRFNLKLLDILADDWEVVEENPHPEGSNLWAAWWLERGRHVTRAEWGGGYALANKATGAIRIVDCRGICTIERLSVSDLAATDWRLVDE